MRQRLAHRPPRGDAREKRWRNAEECRDAVCGASLASLGRTGAAAVDAKPKQASPAARARCARRALSLSPLSRTEDSLLVQPPGGSNPRCSGRGGTMAMEGRYALRAAARCGALPSLRHRGHRGLLRSGQHVHVQLPEDLAGPTPLVHCFGEHPLPANAFFCCILILHAPAELLLVAGWLCALLHFARLPSITLTAAFQSKC